MLYILAISSLAVYGIVLAGWSSGNHYSLLGALRSAAQMVSYEVSIGLTLGGVLMFAGHAAAWSASSQAQVNQGIWFVLAQPLGFVLYGIAAIAEVNRAPFDLPEAEQELVAGYLTEFSGLRWSLFQMAEYINMITVSSVAGDALLRRLDARRARAASWAAPFIWYRRQGGVLPLRLHLAARHAAAHPLRPVDALRLAGAAAALGAQCCWSRRRSSRFELAVVGDAAFGLAVC